MPPKLFLNVLASASLRHDTLEQAAVDSLEVGPQGTLRLHKTLHQYEFNPSGMKHNVTAPLAAGVQAIRQSYQISEQDVELLEELGSGACGTVYKAFLPREARWVAVKKISVLDRSKRHQLLNDIKALVNGPLVDGLTAFFGAYHSAATGHISIVLEYMDAGSLQDLLEREGEVRQEGGAAWEREDVQGWEEGDSIKAVRLKDPGLSQPRAVDCAPVRPPASFPALLNHASQWSRGPFSEPPASQGPLSASRVVQASLASSRVGSSPLVEAEEESPLKLSAARRARQGAWERKGAARGEAGVLSRSGTEAERPGAGAERGTIHKAAVPPTPRDAPASLPAPSLPGPRPAPSLPAPRPPPSSKALPERVVASIARLVLPALAGLHAHHTVHRDIKPANILLSSSGEAKLSDFGISAWVGATVAQCETFLGTLSYMSPERIAGQAYGFPADVWALGLTLLQAARGEYPYDASQGALPLMLQMLEDDCPLGPLKWKDENDKGTESDDLSRGTAVPTPLPPTPPPHVMAPDLCDMLKRSMARDPAARPTAAELCAHPFLRRCAPDASAARAQLRAFLRPRLSPAARRGEAVRVALARYLALLAGSWRGATALDALASCLGEQATLCADGARCRGRFTVAERLAAGLGALAPWGELAFEIEHLDDQVLVRGAACSAADQHLGSSAPRPCSQRPLHVLAQLTAVLVARQERLPTSGKESGANAVATAKLLGRVSSCLHLELSSLDAPVPGAGFRVLQHTARWVDPPLLPRNVGHQRCRMQ